ncbi:MAG: hypothetical protein OHK0021_22730 [Bryobacter sp.]
MSGGVRGLGGGCEFTLAGITGWITGATDVGVLVPGSTTNLLNFVPDGSNVAYTNGAFISQTVADTALADGTYT